jgi:hypothetical protein
MDISVHGLLTRDELMMNQPRPRKLSRLQKLYETLHIHLPFK